MIKSNKVTKLSALICTFLVLGVAGFNIQGQTTKVVQNSRGSGTDNGRKKDKPQEPAPSPTKPPVAAPDVAPPVPQPTSPSNGLKAKRAGIPRIGLVTVGGTVPPEQDQAVRSQFYEMIYGNRDTSAFEAVLLTETYDKSILLEARKAGCDFVLFLNVESTIKQVSEKGPGLLGRLMPIVTGPNGLGPNSPIGSWLPRLPNKTYQIENSLSSSSALLDEITKVTGNKDSATLKYKLLKSSGEIAIPETSLKKTATKKQEPILRNLLTEAGNQILNSIPTP